MAIYDQKLRHWPVPDETFVVPSRYGKTHVIASGNHASPALVLLHPEAVGSLVWSSITPALSQQYRLYAPDTIGDMGRSQLDDPDRYPKKGRDYSAWLDDVYGQLDIATADVIGGSMGGWIAMHRAIEAPDRVRRCCAPRLTRDPSLGSPSKSSGLCQPSTAETAHFRQRAAAWLPLPATVGSSAWVGRSRRSRR
jgi:pimeloyl-ACP methyl ester carboxylesterase